MEVRVHARNVALTDQLRTEVEEKVGHAGRFFDGSGDVDVEFSEEQNPRLHDARFRMELTARAAGHTVRIETAAATPQAALDLGVERFNRQLRRLKERLIDRGRKAEARAGAAAASEAAQGFDETEIVRVKQFVMKPMSVEEAALQMEMLGHDFYFFSSAQNSRPSVLYRRRDGRLGLIEPA